MTAIHAVLYAEGNVSDVFKILNSKGYRLEHPKDKVNPDSPAPVPLTRHHLANFGQVWGIMLRRAYRDAIAQPPHVDFCRELSMGRPGSVLFHALPADVLDVDGIQREVYLMSLVARALYDAEVPMYMQLEADMEPQGRIFGVNPRQGIMLDHADLVTSLVNY